MSPVWNKMPERHGELAFMRVDAEPDDGFAAQVLQEAFVSEQMLALGPCLAFYQDCMELKKWRYEGVDVGAFTRRLKLVAEATPEELEKGPEPERDHFKSIILY